MKNHTSGRSRLPRGLECPRCGCRHFFTTHTEPLRDGRIRRRRLCRYCGRRIVTYEAVLDGRHTSDR